MGQDYTDSSRGVLRSVGGQDYSFTPTYLRKRDPINPPASPDVKPKEQQGYYPVNSLWTNTRNQNVWLLTGIINNLGKWVLISSGGSGPSVKFGVPLGTSPISPDMNGLLNFTSTGGTLQITGSAGGTGNQNINFDLTGGAVAIEKIQGDDGVNIVPTAGIIKIFGATVANATHAKPVFFLEKSATTDTEELDIQVTTTSTSGAKNINNAGLASFDSTSFTVDAATGFVQLVGSGAPLEKINVQTGTTPVVPTAGAITVNGALVAAGTNPVRTDGTGVSTFAVEVQTSQALAATDSTKVGLSNYLNSQFSVDANGFVQILPSALPIGVSNLGIAYSAGTFTVQGFDGTALSATNPGIVWLQSASVPGKLKRYLITANQTFTDAAGSNQISGNNFGVTAGIAWNTDVPFFLYAVQNAAESQIAFMISRTPARNGAPAAGNIGQSGIPNATTQGSFFSLLAITAADYASNPCLVIGSFRMRKTTVANDWTVQTLSQNNADDGIGCFSEVNTFAMPVSQNGAATGKYLLDNGGTAPLFNIQIVRYKVDRSGLVTIAYDLNGDPGSGAGAGGVAAQLAVPFQIASISGTNIPTGNVLITVSTGLGTVTVNANQVANFMQISQFTGGNVQNSDFSAGNRSIQGTLRYNLNNA